MPAIQTIYRKQVERVDRILEPSAQKLVPVKEAIIYPAQFPILLRERLQGRSVAEVADYLGIPQKDVNRLLAAHKGHLQEDGPKGGLRNRRPARMSQNR